MNKTIVLPEVTRTLIDMQAPLIAEARRGIWGGRNDSGLDKEVKDVKMGLRGEFAVWFSKGGLSYSPPPNVEVQNNPIHGEDLRGNYQIKTCPVGYPPSWVFQDTDNCMTNPNSMKIAVFCRDLGDINGIEIFGEVTVKTLHQYNCFQQMRKYIPNKRAVYYDYLREKGLL
jgi:hypothetical protein